jgi:small-conductance mechanosensitive channel
VAGLAASLNCLSLSTPPLVKPGVLAAAPHNAVRLADHAFDWLRTDSLTAGIAIGLGVALYLVLLALRFGIKRALRYGQGTPPPPVTGWRGFIARMVGSTGGFFLGAFAAEAVANVVAAPGTLRHPIGVVFTIAAAIQGAIWVRELILSLVERRAASGEEESGISSALGIIRVLVNVVVWALALILVLDNLGVNVTALVAGLGVGGIAIGLAAQGIFADLFAALAILFDRPFRAGDTIHFGATTGTVEAIGLKTTRIRALSGEQVIISNTKLLDQQIANLRRIEQRRVVQTLYLSLGTSATELARVPAMAAAIIGATEHARFDRAHVSALTLDAVEVELVYFTTVADYAVMMDARQSLLLGMLKALAEAGIELAERLQVQGAPRQRDGGERGEQPDQSGLIARERS